ncbi:MAG: nucleotide kinase domain-containing protein [Vicinamibacterales bacterium]
MVLFITERDAVRERREVGLKPPWTADPAIAGYRYCNVRREDDKVTRWIAANWRNSNATHPNLVLAMVLARMVNWPDSLDQIGFPFKWDPNRVKMILQLRQSNKLKTWSAAYMITTCGKRMSKEEYVVDYVCGQVASMTYGDFEFRNFTLASAWKRLSIADGLGSFLAAQVVADLKNTPGHSLAQAPDWWVWSAPGPGSLRGLNWFFHDKPDGPITATKYEAKIQECWAAVRELLPENLQDLHMQDFQNCLCEFGKYCRIRYGDGRVRSRYIART